MVYGSVENVASMEIFIAWLLAPISGADTHTISYEHQWHARFMTLSWGVIIPLGILIARYFKITRGQNWPLQLDNKFWWKTHLVLQIGGSVLSLWALNYVMDWGFGNERLAVSLHEVIGWSLVLLSLSQMIGGAFRGTKGEIPPNGLVLETTYSRPGDHYEMTRRRCLFEYLHKMGGYLALALACSNILIGLGISDAPRWMWLTIVGYWALLMAVSCILQRQGRCVDTYQAIYGPGPALPGNQRRPIGWGIRRYEANEWPPDRHHRP